MDAIEALKTRRCVRAYLNKPVPREIIEDLIDCGRLAASAINIQPCEFVVVTDAAVRQQLADRQGPDWQHAWDLRSKPKTKVRR